MKKYITILFLLFFSSAIAQSDTAKLKLVFNFINSNEFRIAFKDSLSKEIEKRVITTDYKKNRKKYTKEEWQDASMWLDGNNCFMPVQYYKNDSLLMGKTEKVIFTSTHFHKVPFEMKYFYWTNKEGSTIYLLNPNFKNENIIEIEFYSGSYLSLYRQGISQTLQLKIADYDSVRFVSYQVIMHN